MKQRLTQMTLLVAACVAILAACSTVQPKCTAVEDNAPHHYLMGMKALEENKVATAQEKFERALYCDDGFSIAHAGMAIVSAEKVKAQTDAGFRDVEIERVAEELKKAKKYADGPDQYFDFYASVIRTDTLMKPKGWLVDAEDAYSDGSKLKVDEFNLSYYKGTEALPYFMGVAWLEGMEFQKARDSFGTVLNAKREGKWHEKADKGWKRADKIMRAMGGITVGDIGKTIAPKEKVTRADLAALLIDEMKIEKLLAGRIPVASQAVRTAEFTPADMTSHPFKEEVLTLMKWNVRGMEPKYDETTHAYLFMPSDSVTRGEMALILEDVLIKLTGDEKLATAYFGQERSPFPDVRPSSNLYNAVMNMISRSIMESELTGEFRISEPVDGAEALLAMRMLKQKMNIY
uniref:S-layer domain protein n=1 Tax=Geobacter sp. (strain M21) TaxID=443144 RepID=C6DZB6_GEOSM